MTYIPNGDHLIAGERITASETFQSDPANGEAMRVSIGTADHVDRACRTAEEAFWTFGASSRELRAKFLHAIADQIEAHSADITRIGTAESGLPEGRLEGERGRTTGQLRLFADHILKIDHLDVRHDAALPDRQPAPRPDIRTMQRPIGPVGVFGASNFPLAFSTAGGDTASALAAGCPVIVKGHEAHPGTAEIVAKAIDDARRECGLHPGVFSLIQGGSHEAAKALVRHPLIKAVGFTGSLAGGRALFNLCASRSEPIPFFGELGSINPMFILPAALAARGSEIGAGWAGSLTMGVGQFCTNPGVVVLIAGEGADEFKAVAKDALAEVAHQTMLTSGIASAYRAGQARLTNDTRVSAVFERQSSAREAAPSLYCTTGAEWLSAPHELGQEVFGPLGLIVVAEDAREMRAVAHSLEGQLTATLHMNEADHELARTLMPIIERKAGRILANGFPTGVEVVDAMVHGGPYPASTNFGATSVGTLAIRRFMRPVCYQNFDVTLLHPDLTASG